MAMINAPWHMSVEQIAEHAGRHSSDALGIDLATPIDFTRPFICPSLTPLFYTPVWNDLCAADQLRHTQLSALSFNELIAWFEGGFTATLRALMRSNRVPASVRDLLPRFIDDESRHQKMWWALNRLADPQRYRDDSMSITRIAPMACFLLQWLAGRPIRFPVAVWLMLVLEEHANEIARRCAAQRPSQIEPHFAAAYLAHVRDETRHVQIDWHLLDALCPTMNYRQQRLNGWLFGQVIKRMLLRTENAAMSVATALASESPTVRRQLPRIRAELRQVALHPDYRSMMFSSETSPVTFHLMAKYPLLREAVK